MLTYREETIDNLPWIVPVLVPHRVPETLPQGSFRPALTGRTGQHYYWAIDDAFKDSNIVDICSGTGNLDAIAQDNISLTRVDPLYSSPALRKRMRANSKCPQKMKLVSGSAFRVPLPDNCADVVLDLFGTMHYFPSMIYCTPFDQIVHSDPCTLSRTRKRHAQNALYAFFCSLKEKLRITKPGGRIIAGPMPDEQLYLKLVEPSLLSMHKKRIIQYKLRRNGEDAWIYINNQEGRAVPASEDRRRTPAISQTLP